LLRGIAHFHPRFGRSRAAAVPFLRREAGRTWAELRAATDLV